MKFLSLVFAMAIFIFPLVCSLAQDKNCDHNCEIQDYKPVCATDDKGDTKTFNNWCILKTENCLRGTNYQKTADGDCP